MLKYDLPAFSRLSFPATIPSSSENFIKYVIQLESEKINKQSTLNLGANPVNIRLSMFNIHQNVYITFGQPTSS